MAEYLVLARKYRSATFDEVVGQEHIADTLVNAIKAGRVAHAFLFAGTRGVGKTTMARILAKALNCLKVDAPTPTPCNKCEACLAIARGDDMDVVEIDGASNRGIEQIRELRNNAIYTPARCRYKVYYIDEVHMLTREAFNALLKTLEEPPGHVKFIFATTEPEKLPATVISRCQRFDFRNIPTGRIAEHLTAICKSEKSKADDDAIYRIARAAAGSMRDGLSLLDQLLAAGSGKITQQDVIDILGTPSDERTAAIIAAIAAGDAAAALGELDSLLAAGVTLESAIAAIGETFRQMMLAVACGPDSNLIELPDVARKTVVELADGFTLPVLVQSVGVCQTTGRNLRGLSSARGLVEAALVRLAAAEKFADADSLIQRLEALAGGGVAPIGQKKKPLAPGRDRAAAPAPQSPQQPSPATLEDPKWEMSYMADQWGAIVGALATARQGQVSGLLAPAKVLQLDDSTVRLGFDDAHESIRKRCQAMADRIDSALGKLFGRRVHCEYVPTGAPGAPTAPANGQAPAAPRLSTADRQEVNGDPAVRAVLDFFDGSIEYIRPNDEAPVEETD